MTYKIIQITLFLELLLFSVISGQYEIKCDYLKNPGKIKSYVDSCALFWLPSYDTLFGGFFSNVARNGKVTDINSKNMLTQTRTAYGMARAFMLSGDTSYLRYARGALDFMYEHAWDKDHGGWFNEMNREGNPLPGGQYNHIKWSFMQHYALLGIAAMFDAVRNEKDKDFLLKGRNAVDKYLWDFRTNYSGYYNSAGNDWSNPEGKGFTPTVDAITTHSLSLYLLTYKPEHKERLLTLADNVIHHMLPAMSLFKYGYPEEYSSDWKPEINNTLVFTGHLLKSAWCLTRTYLVEPRKEYLDFSNTILEHVLAKGYDEQYGGCYKEFNGLTGMRYDSNKEWWEMEQAFTSGIMNYYITKDERFLKMADETLDFFMKYFVDHQYGEVYQTTTRTGEVSIGSKASYWKAGYHSIELGYYVYLYGNIFIHNKPVTLFYYIQPADSAREIKLTPLTVNSDKLVISEVQLNGQSYNQYAPDHRILNIPPNTGGIFRVTFDNSLNTAIASKEYPLDFRLEQNYPNPFNPQTVIEYEINRNGHVILEVFDVTGQKVKKLVDSYESRGNHKVTWNGYSDTGIKASGGVYFFQFIFENERFVKKGIMIN